MKPVTKTQSRPMMTPSGDDQFLNPIERVVDDIARFSTRIRELNSLIAGLKHELQQHYEQGTFEENQKFGDLKVFKVKKTGSYEYPEEVVEKINQLKRKAELDHKLEPKKIEYWVVR